MLVWISQKGISDPIEDKGIIFVETEGAFAYIRVTKGGYKWMTEPFPSKRIPDNRTVVLKDSFAPVILEVMSKKDIFNQKEFMEKVHNCKMEFKGNILHYESIYGDSFTLDSGFKKAPTVNGSDVQYSSDKVFISPFLNADYNSGVVTIKKGKRTKVLDFN